MDLSRHVFGACGSDVKTKKKKQTFRRRSLFQTVSAQLQSHQKGPCSRKNLGVVSCFNVQPYLASCQATHRWPCMTLPRSNRVEMVNQGGPDRDEWPNNRIQLSKMNICIRLQIYLNLTNVYILISDYIIITNTIHVMFEWLCLDSFHHLSPSSNALHEMSQTLFRFHNLHELLKKIWNGYLSEAIQGGWLSNSGNASRKSLWRTSTMDIHGMLRPSATTFKNNIGTLGSSCGHIWYIILGCVF